jgi:hypothetical protein
MTQLPRREPPSFHILSVSLFINRPVIRHCIVWATDSVVKQILTLISSFYLCGYVCEGKAPTIRHKSSSQLYYYAVLFSPGLRSSVACRQTVHNALFMCFHGHISHSGRIFSRPARISTKPCFHYSLPGLEIKITSLLLLHSDWLQSVQGRMWGAVMQRGLHWMKQNALRMNLKC